MEHIENSKFCGYTLQNRRKFDLFRMKTTFQHVLNIKSVFKTDFTALNFVW